MMDRFATVCLVLIVMIGRLTINPRTEGIPTWDLSYEAFAHIFVGFLIGAACSGWLVGQRAFYGWMAFLITIWEVIIFVIQKNMG